MKSYRVSFQYSERTYCTNIVKATNENIIHEEYSKYKWHDMRLATESDIEEATRKGMPIITLN